jgi:hypothetical protein
MSYGRTLPEPQVMGKKKQQPPKPRKKRPPQPPRESAFDRVEFQAPIDWVRRLDEMAASLGLSRSAFVRLAVNKFMQAEDKEAQ